MPRTIFIDFNGSRSYIEIMFPMHKGPKRMVKLLDSLCLVPSFYSVDYPCFPPLQMLIVSGQIETSFEKQCVVTGSYCWGIGAPDGEAPVEDVEHHEGVDFDEALSENDSVHMGGV